METFGHLAVGLQIALTPVNFAYLIVGLVAGMVVGVFPGLGPAAGIAILLPLTFNVEPVTAVVMLAAIYYGSMYGATATAILLNTPGVSAVVASTFDGYPLAQQGRAGPALVMQAVASFVGGTVGLLLLTLLAPAFTRVARSFGPPEFFMLVMAGMLALAVMLGRNRRLGMVSALLGFAVATVGVDVGTGHQRFTFGSPDLMGGMDFIALAIGLFGIGELLESVYSGLHRSGWGGPVVRLGSVRIWPEASDWLECRFTLIRGSLIGFGVGVIPGAGATLASLMAYSLEKTISRTPERFGTGVMSGLVAPEAANNAASSGAMIPLLTLGIPGSASTAVLLGAFLMWGLRPGPQLMTDNPEFAWGLIASMYVGNMMLVVLSIVAIPLFTFAARVPYAVLAPVVVVLCAIGTFAVNGSVTDVWIMLMAGIFGFFMKRQGFSPAAMVVAIVLGPLAESTLRQSLIISEGSLLIFLQRPVALALGVLIALLVFAGPMSSRLALLRRMSPSTSEPG